MYDIFQVAASLGIKQKHCYPDQTAWYVCPFCDDTKGHLNINKKKGLWHCTRCGEAGGVTGLVEKHEGISHVEAVTFLRNGQNGKDFVQRKKEILAANPTCVQEPIASIDVRDATYRALLKELSLSTLHVANLKKRGLSEKAIKNRQYRSVPSTFDTEIAQKLFQNGCVLAGVPGFFCEGGVWKVSFRFRGILNPFVSLEKKIMCLQIRNDKPGKEKKKYPWLSSVGLPRGCGASISEAHVVAYRGEDTVCLTEGPLKADVAAYLYYLHRGRLD